MITTATNPTPELEDDEPRHGPLTRWIVVDYNGAEFADASFATEAEANARCQQIRANGWHAAVTFDDPDYDPTPE